MAGRVTTLCAVCVLSFGCQKAEVRRHERPSERELEEQLEEQYAAWAARQPRPPQQVVGEIETLLAQNPCIGALDRWSRNYAYSEDMPSRTLYPGIIAFHLKEAGRFGVRPGLHITEPNSWAINDDTPIKMVWGDYQVSTGRVSIAFCGNNIGPSQGPTDINRLDEYDDDLKARQAKERGVQTR